MQETAKTVGVGRVFIVGRLYDLLVEWKGKDGDVQVVCHREEKLIRRNTVASAYNRAFRAMGLRVRSVTHVLRRTVTTLHAEQTRDLAATQAFLVHTDIKTTQI